MCPTGVTPALSVPAGLLGFFFIKTYTLLLQRIGIVTKPFTPQENTVIQTCAVAGAALVISGGFGYSLLGEHRSHHYSLHCHVMWRKFLSS